MKHLRPRLLVAASLAAVAFALSLTACDTDQPDTPDPLLSAQANLGAWTWADVGGMQCRDGSATGLGARLMEGSDDLVIFMEGGGACFLSDTCEENRPRFGEMDFEDLVKDGYGSAGLFNASNEENPVRDWNVIYVPYCTGDVHTGSRTDVTNEQLGITEPQQFVGYRNAQRVLEVLLRHFDDGLDQVLVTGSSAGGFGTLGFYKDVANAFGDAEVTLLNDSGPIFANDAILPPQLQGIWLQLWGLGAALPPAPELRQLDGLENIYDYYATAYPEANLGLMTYDQDATIRFFFSFGRALQDESCAESLSRDTPCISGAAYEAALDSLRAHVLPPTWRTYYAAGEQHTFLRDEERFYNAATGGLSPAQWIGQLLNGEAPNVAPED